MTQVNQVYWSKVAESDLIAIIQYIHAQSPKSASKVFTAIKNKVADLVIFQERGRVVPELLAQGINQYRELIIAPWRVIYRCTTDAVYVLSVIDSRRNVEDVLLGRFIRE
jgi:toxin ParE1/3/4